MSSPCQESHWVWVHKLAQPRGPDQEQGAGGQVHWGLAVHLPGRGVCPQVAWERVWIIFLHKSHPCSDTPRLGTTCTCTTSPREPPTPLGRYGAVPFTRMRSPSCSVTRLTEPRDTTSRKWGCPRKWWLIGRTLPKRGMWQFYKNLLSPFSSLLYSLCDSEQGQL